MRLVFERAETGAKYGCAQKDVAWSDSMFMVGFQDGTGCNVLSENYYRSVTLDVPR